MAGFVNSKAIAILMATYNGERYLREQIDSILNQDNDDWTLYIRDDGSEDNTLLIIDEYIRKYDSIILIKDRLGSKGASGNFFQLLQSVDSSYYMFADQDDIWLPDKIKKAYAQMKILEQKYISYPIVIGTDLVVVDNLLNVLSKSLWHICKINTSLLKDVDYLGICNGFVGCTMIINEKVKKIIEPTLPTNIIHDYWIAMNVAINNGILDFMSDAQILYRQHTQNTIGAERIDMIYYLKRLFKLDKIFRQNMDMYLMNKHLLGRSFMGYLYYKVLYIIKR